MPTADQSITPGALPLYIGSPIVADGGSYAYRGDLFAYDQSTGLLSTLSSISASLAGTAEQGYRNQASTLPSLVLPPDDTVAIRLNSSYEQHVLVTIPGDANGDGRVDLNDLTIVLANFGQTGRTWAQGEFTGDGTLDVNDLTIVLANFGHSAAAGINAVPEPSCVILLGLVAIGLLAYAHHSSTNRSK